MTSVGAPCTASWRCDSRPRDANSALAREKTSTLAVRLGRSWHGLRRRREFLPAAAALDDKRAARLDQVLVQVPTRVLEQVFDLRRVLIQDLAESTACDGAD